MTDYLELLLERRREEDEEKESLRLGAEEAAVVPPKSTAESGPDIPRQVRTGWEGRPELSVGREPYLPGAAIGRRTAGTPGLFGAILTQAGEIGAAPRGRTAAARDALEEALGRAEDVLGGPEGDGRGQPGLSGLSARDAGVPSGGAAALARRLSRAAASEPGVVPAARRAVFDEGTRESAPGADWEEFDRRLERDARRYDGGMWVY